VVALLGAVVVALLVAVWVLQRRHAAHKAAEALAKANAANPVHA
jgi:hypothetical protein